MNKNQASAGAWAPEAEYLDRPRPCKQKGGTLLVREVGSLEEQAAALADPDLVRPTRCPSCLTGVMHVHERRARVFRGEIGQAVVTEVLIFRCADRERCGAVWRLLPRFLARCLHRRWSLIAAALGLEGEDARHRVPRRTRQRWRQRLGLSAAVLVVLLEATGVERWREVAARVTSAGLRHDLVLAEGDLAELALVLDEQLGGVRLM